MLAGFGEVEEDAGQSWIGELLSTALKRANALGHVCKSMLGVGSLLSTTIHFTSTELRKGYWNPR
jgi:hypothetical protein